VSSCLSSSDRGSVSLDWTKPLSEEKSDTFLHVMEQLENSYSILCHRLAWPLLNMLRAMRERQRVWHCAEPCPVRPGKFSQQQRAARGCDQ